MKVKVICLALLAVGMTGCAAAHYVESRDSRLTLSLRVPDAVQVQFASSIDDYVLHDAAQNRFGVWQVTVPNASGFAYFYVVDGSPYLPECRFTETDDFGSQNCLYLP